ncbi:MAG: nuclear transport factor 2 family protein [Bryobacteraceae bacterium]|nr:nuclear transport factor 2 family protein [Bryobacteraceae bacterium]
METANLSINQISPEAFTWYLSYLAALDAKDIEKYGRFLAEDCVMIQNNNPPVTGKDAILAGLGKYWQTFGKLEHELLNIYGTDHAFALEACNHYTRLDGEKVTVRAVALTDRNANGLVRRFRVYTDVSPVFATTAPKQN